MRVRSFNFVSQYLSQSQIEMIREDYIDKNGKSPFQPIKWTQENRKVPKVIKKYPDVNETLWILIRYEGAFDRLSISDDYEHDLRNEYQRAIAINFTNDEITWELFKNQPKKHNHKKYMKTYSKVKDNA